MLISPHGNELINRFIQDNTLDPSKYPVIIVDDVAVSDLYQIALGAFSPLTGFLDEADYIAVRDTMHLSNGLAWSMPITLSVSENESANIPINHTVYLADSSRRIVAKMTVTSKYRPDRDREAQAVFRTTDTDHPGVARLANRPPIYLGGPVEVYEGADMAFAEFFKTPQQTREMIAENGWKTVAGFQTRNPIHRAHEYIQKCALEIVDGLMLHPLVGPTKSDDVPAEVRIESYQAILKHYYPSDRVLFSVYTAAMRYGGPREAIFHALVRKNFGCTHFVVGRDHAGVGNFYGSYDAQEIFKEFNDGELGIMPLFFEHAFYCKRCSGMATTKTCPHPTEERIHLSGTKVRMMLRNNLPLPKEFSRPEVVKVLQTHYNRETTKETPIIDS